MAEQTLETLFARYCGDGDIDALAEVFDRVAPDLQRLAQRLCGDRNRAEDLVQATFLAALERPGTFEAGRALRPWLLGILVNRASVDRRKSERTPEVDRLEPREVETPLAATSASETRAVVERAIADLPPKLRRVVEAKLIEDRDTAALAEELAISRGALRVRLHRGLERLRRALPPSLATVFAAMFIHSRGLAQVRSLVLQEAAHQAGGSAVAAASAGAMGMGALMSKKLVGAVAALVLIVVAMVIVRLEPPEDSSSEYSEQLQAPMAAVASAVDSSPSSQQSPSSSDLVDARIPAQSTQSIRVVVRRDGSPAPHAEIRLLEVARIDPQTLESGAAADLGVADFFDHFGSLFIANAAGEADIPLSGQQASIYAKLEGYGAWLPAASAQEGVLLLDLKRLSNVIALVQDPHGRPLADVPVALEVGVQDEERVAREPGNSIDLITKRTSPSGRVAFQDFVDRVKWDPPGEPFYAVRLAIPGTDYFEQFDPEPVLSDPVILTMPDIGSVRVTARDHNGDLLDLNATVSLRTLGQIGSSATTTSMDAGVAEFPFVGLGCRFRVRLSSRELGIERISEFRGPEHIGEHVEVDLVAPAAKSVSGRVFGTNSAPLAGRSVVVLLHSTQLTPLQRTSVRTLADGTFRVELTDSIEVGMQLRASVLTRIAGRWESRADNDMLVRFEGEDLQLGDFFLLDAETELHGVCVDREGLAVAGLQIVLGQDLTEDSVSTTTDETGRFEVNGLWPHDIPVSADLDSKWLVMEPATVRRGSECARIVVARGGSVEGSVLFDPEVTLPEIRFTVAKQGDEDPHRTCSIDAIDGRFSLEGLAPGRYEGRLTYMGRSLIEISNLELQIDEVLRPDALQSFDLRGLYRVQRLVVEGGVESHVESIVTANLDGAIVALARVRDNELAQLVMPAAPAPLISIQKPGFRPCTFEPTADVLTVVLREGLPVTLVTEDRPAIERGDFTVSLALTLEHDGDPRLPADIWTIRVSNQLATDGRADTILPGPGLYRLERSLRTTGGGDVKISTPFTALEQSVEVRESDAGNELYITLPDDLFGDS